ncbi:MAG: hypothetical protein EPO25_11185 [Gammaproteobacteria bacterium]|nr:MAG: hypothetical protein EPO25_11185 [Gammaproteobacteria bacterium]
MAGAGGPGAGRQGVRVIDFFDAAVKYYARHTAFVEADTGNRMTYAEADVAAHHVAAAVRGHGYAKGVHVGILAPNSTAAFSTLVGLFRAECVWLPINPRNSIETNVEVLRFCDCELLFYHSSLEADALRIKSAVAGIRDLVCLDRSGTGVPSLAEWADGFRHRFEIGPEEDGDLLAIIPTGGTTGTFKAVMMAHHAVETMFANSYAHFRYHDGSVHLLAAPMTHAAGMLGCMHFARGGSNVMLSRPEPEAVMRAIESYRVTHLFLPPTVLYKMLDHPRVRDYDYSSLIHFIVAAAPTSVAKLKQAIEVFGPVMTEGFGQTEAPAMITAKAPWDYVGADRRINERRLASAGRPCVLNHVEIMADDGNFCPPGQAGEIVVRGRLVNPGYYKNPEATAEAHRFGWHHTGDVGVMDEDGYITIVDRKKDMIITGGFNVFSNEIEQVIAAHPAVQECAVIGVPDEKWGESIKAVVVLRGDDVVTAEELMLLVRAQLGAVKCPRSVEFTAELPRSPVGKVLKAELRKPHWRGRSRAVN